MNLKELASKYIQNTEHVFEEVKITQGSITLKKEHVLSVIETAKAYFNDAKHYQEKKRFETSLVAVTYCEGLLDALRFLGIVDFSW